MVGSFGNERERGGRGGGEREGEVEWREGANKYQSKQKSHTKRLAT
jgi:hypothetical protein